MKCNLNHESHSSEVGSLEISGHTTDYLCSALDEMELEYMPSQNNSLLVNIRGDSNKVFQELLRMDVLVSPGEVFGLPSYIRISIGTHEQNNRFVGALSRVLALLELDYFVIAGN